MITDELPPTVVSFGEDVLKKMETAARLVDERLERATSALANAGIRFALSGSNATSIWISTVDISAVRQARNVELILRRQDLEQVDAALRAAGFVQRNHDECLRYLDGPWGTWRDGMEISFGGELFLGRSSGHMIPFPSDNEVVCGQQVLRLEVLVQFQLARFRLDDAVDLRDMIDVGLLDRSWLGKLPPELATRLQELLDNPDG